MSIQEKLPDFKNKLFFYYKSVLITVFVICIIVVLLNLLLYYLNVDLGQKVTAADLVTHPNHPVSAVTQSIIDPSQMKNVLLSDAKLYPQVKLGLSYIDLNTGTSTDVNGSTEFTGASTTKVIIASLLLSQVEQGKHSLNDKINNITLQTYLQKMINKSDNDAWETIMNYIGFRYQTPYANQIGAYSYDAVNNRINPNDMAHVLAELYKGQLLNQQDTQLLLSYMQHTNDDDLIPAVVPEGVSVYHKYGSFDGDLHDAAIIDNGKNPFVLAIYTATGSGTLSYDAKINLFHQITTDVETASGIQMPLTPTPITN